jgi:phage terminase large subunit-like protein
VRRKRAIAPVMLGSTQPRIAPPAPAKHRGKEYAQTASAAGISLMPWQALAARYLMARGPDGWTFRDVVIVCARQNGKTELLVPRILMDLRAGKRILHTAHRMRLPRKVFLRVARILGQEAEVIRYAQGQEEIFMSNGGSYVIFAAQRGARGESADTLIVDEVREFEDFDAMAATSPTLAASPDPQTIYLSNAGSEASVVLNDLRRRGENGGDGEFAYLE